MPTLFKTLAELCENLKSTTKRNIMINLVASFILQLEVRETSAAVLMLIGRAFPKWDQRVLEVSWVALGTIIRKILNLSDEAYFQAFDKTGDAGEAIESLFREGKIRRQSTLFQNELTILEVHRSFNAIAGITGTGSRERKERLLETLFSSATPLEVKYIVKILIGEMRTGFHEGLMELAVSHAYKIPLKVVQRAGMLAGDIGEVATLAKIKGEEGLQRLKLKVFRPLKPMLAQKIESITEALKEHGGKIALEHKIDGARVQIHKSRNIVKIFSRRLTDVTSSLPEIVELCQKEIEEAEVVLEGELVAVNKKGKPMPFQNLMRRFRRIHKIKRIAEEIPIRLYLFDLLYINGKSLINQKYTKRRERLGKLAGSIPLTKNIIASDPDVAEEFYKQAIEEGHEGLMLKNLDSLYTPGVRGKKWLKMKKVLEPLDLVVVAAEYGYGRRHGWLSDYHLAAQDPDTNELLTVGKTFKGLTDAEIIEMTKRLKGLTVRREGNKVIVVPQIVVEVSYNEVQKSPKYSCGMALRFARITRIRYDKSVNEVDTIHKVREIYNNQFQRKSRAPQL